MDEFIDVLTPRVDNWKKLEQAIKPCRRFIASSMKGGPVHLSGAIWKQSLESVLRENFTATGSSNQIWTMHLCLGTVEEIKDSNSDSSSDSNNLKKKPANRKIKKELLNQKIKKESGNYTTTQKIKPSTTAELLGVLSSSPTRVVSNKRSFSDFSAKEKDLETANLNATVIENKKQQQEEGKEEQERQEGQEEQEEQEQEKEQENKDCEEDGNKNRIEEDVTMDAPAQRTRYHHKRR